MSMKEEWKISYRIFRIRKRIIKNIEPCAIPSAEGVCLDRIGALYGVKRNRLFSETDRSFRKKILYAVKEPEQ